VVVEILAVDLMLDHATGADQVWKPMLLGMLEQLVVQYFLLLVETL
tara:strand:- start:151 stop:288 length:138 start_codon:yes stop_codon:yes gene_type:complete